MGAAGRRPYRSPPAALTPGSVRLMPLPPTAARPQRPGARAAVFALCAALGAAAPSGCGYTTRPGLAPHLKTVYVKPFANKIDLSQLQTGYNQFPLYRHQLEVDITNAVINRYQFTGLLRPARSGQADARLEGELTAFRKDPLRYDASQQVEEWRLNIVVSLKFWDQASNTLVWEEEGFTGDTTYFAIGASAESESAALDRAVVDLARRIVERSVENW